MSRKYRSTKASRDESRVNYVLFTTARQSKETKSSLVQASMLDMNFLDRGDSRRPKKAGYTTPGRVRLVLRSPRNRYDWSRMGKRTRLRNPDPSRWNQGTDLET